MNSSVFDFAKRNLGFSTDPKLHFRSVTLPRLHNSSQTIPLSDLQYWSYYSNLFDFPSDVPTLISISELRRAILLQPDNVSNLIKFLVNKLDFLVHSESVHTVLIDSYREINSTISNRSSLSHQLKGLGQTVPSTLLNSAADIVGVGPSNHKLPKGPLREILNCVRVLTRILPLLLEFSVTSDQINHPISIAPSSSLKPNNSQFDWILHLLWYPQSDSNSKDDQSLDHQITPTQPQFVIDEDESSDDQDSVQTPRPLETEKNQRSPISIQPSSHQHSTHPPLIISLINTILDLLFLPGVCVPPSSSNLNSNKRYPIWTAGTGCSQVPMDHSSTHNSSKVEVLRLLLAVLSQPLYSPPHLSCSPSSIIDIIGLNDLDQSPQPFWKVLRFPNPALAYITTQIPKQQLLGLLCSLINTSLAPSGTAFSSPANALNSLANGFGRITQSTISNLSTPPPLSSTSSTHSLDSNSNLDPSSRRTSVASINGNNRNNAPSYGGASTTGISQNLPEWCAVVLSLLLLPNPTLHDTSLQAPPKPEPVSESGHHHPGELGKEAELDQTNQFRIYLSKVHRPSDLSFLIDNILIILMKPMTVTSQLLTSDSVIGSSSSLTNSFLNYGCGLTEAILILYFSLDCNPRLMGHLISTKKLSSIIIGLTFICLEQKDHPKPKTGLIKLCAITLQLLTANERKDSSHIFNSKVELPVAIRAQYSVPGTLADFLIVSICSFIFSTSQVQSQQQKLDQQQENHINNPDGSINLNSIYTPLILTISNLSPYLKEIGKSSSARLVRLYTFFSNPINILSDQNNFRLVYYILEIFNNIIHFQIQDNPYIIYSLIKIQQKIDFLATFTLKVGLLEIQKNQIARRQSAPNVHKKKNSNWSPESSLGLNSNKRRNYSIGEESFDEQDEELSTLIKVDKGKGKMKELNRNESSLSITTESTAEQGQELEQERERKRERGRLGGSGMRESSLIRSTSSDQFLVIDSSSSTRKSNASSGFSNSIDTINHTTSGSDWTDLNHVEANNSSKLESDNSHPYNLSNQNSSTLSPISTVNTVGRAKFVPTEAWVASWRDSLPLDTIQIMISELKPKVMTVKNREEEEGRKKKTSHKNDEGSEEDTEVINFLRSATLIGMLPKPKKKSKRSRTFELIPHNPINPIHSLNSMSANGGGGLNWMISFIWSIVFIKDSNSNRGNFFTGSSTSSTNHNGEMNSGRHLATTTTTTTTTTTGWEVNCLKIKLFGLTFLPAKRSSSASNTIKGLFKNFSVSNPS